MRRRTVVAIGLVAPLLVLLPGAPADAVVTCQGEEATIVGVGTETVVGTEGDDVIVAAGVVSAGAGDDTICTSGSHVYAGDGDDSVVTDQSVRSRWIHLGDGDDRFVGGPGADHVGFDARAAGGESGSDDISTGPGDDRVAVGSRTDVPGADRIDLGPGDDEVTVAFRGLGPRGSLTGGPGRDVLTTLHDRGPDDVRLDLPRRELLVGTVAFARWSSLEAFRLRLDHSGRTRVRVTGTAARDDVTLNGARRVEATTGAGADVLRVLGERVPTGWARGGPGRDRVWARFPSTVVDLSRGYAGSPGTPGRRLALSSFDDVTTGRRAVVVGNGRANRLDVACGTVRAGGGDDVVRQVAPTDPFLGDDATAASACRSFVVRGGPGRDRIRGSLSRDGLDGGPGRDSVDGLAGRDRCVAEREVRCER